MSIFERDPNDDRANTFNPCAPGYNPPPYGDNDDDDNDDNDDE